MVSAKAVVLFSGGLDSYLALFLIKEQGVEIEALKFHTNFCQEERAAGYAGDEAALLKMRGITLRVVPLGQEFLEMVARPRHGWGRNMNPCIDCRILMLRKAGEYMRQRGASFVVSGEVLGQRPFSQNPRALALVADESGLSGILLRPLSARLLPETIPEIKGWIDRAKMLAIQGRGRKEQLALARRYGLVNPPTPAGGCLLTDPAYAKRLRSVLGATGFLSEHSTRILRHGRYFSLSPACFLIVGRNERDNFRLMSLLKPGGWLLEPENCPGPVALGFGRPGPAELKEAAKITARYSDRPLGGRISIAVRRGSGGKSESLLVP